INPGPDADWAVQGGTLVLEAVDALAGKPITVSAGVLSTTDPETLGASHVILDDGTFKVTGIGGEVADLIANGDFEDNEGATWPDAPGWTREAGAAGGLPGGLFDGSPYEGAPYGLGHESPLRYTPGYGDHLDTGAYYTIADLEAGKEYTLNYWGIPWVDGSGNKVRVGYTTHPGVLTDLANWDFVPLTLDALDIAVVPALQWEFFSHTFIAGGGENAVYFGGGAVNSMDIDQVSLRLAGAPPIMIDMKGTPISVTDNSVINSLADVAEFGPLDFAGGVLTTIGVETISFLSTTVPVGAVGGFDTGVETNPGQITADIGATIIKRGGADLVLDSELNDVDGVTFDVQAGRLVARHGSNPIDGAILSLSGGEVLLSTKPGVGATVTYDNEVIVNVDSSISAGPGENGDRFVEVTLGSGANGITLDAGLTLSTSNDYTLNVVGAINGPGQLNIANGQVVLSGDVNVGGLH
ncbi:hypothetical protein LCGC14_2592120, partial [marine sediment metagenome]